MIKQCSVKQCTINSVVVLYVNTKNLSHHLYVCSGL